MDLNEFTKYQGATKFTILKILKFCETEKDFDTLKQEILSFPDFDNSFYSVVEMLALIKDFGGLSLRIEAGKEFWLTTETGKEFLAQHAVCQEIDSLFTNNPNLQSVFKDILKYLSVPSEVSAIDEKFGQRSEILSEKVTVHFCLHELEKYGAIFWTNKGWQTSQEWTENLQ